MFYIHCYKTFIMKVVKKDIEKYKEYLEAEHSLNASIRLRDEKHGEVIQFINYVRRKREEREEYKNNKEYVQKLNGDIEFGEAEIKYQRKLFHRTIEYANEAKVKLLKFNVL